MSQSLGVKAAGRDGDYNEKVSQPWESGDHYGRDCTKGCCVWMDCKLSADLLSEDEAAPRQKERRIFEQESI